MSLRVYVILFLEKNNGRTARRIIISSMITKSSELLLINIIIASCASPFPPIIVARAHVSALNRFTRARVCGDNRYQHRTKNPSTCQPRVPFRHNVIQQRQRSNPDDFTTFFFLYHCFIGKSSADRIPDVSTVQTTPLSPSPVAAPYQISSLCLQLWFHRERTNKLFLNSYWQRPVNSKCNLR